MRITRRDVVATSLITLTGGLPSSARAAPKDSDMDFQPHAEAKLTIPRTTYFEFFSQAVGAKFAIWVTTPEGYKEGQRLPAIYTPDGNIAVAQLVPTSSYVWNDPIEPILPFLQISIGYVESDAPDALRIRNRDLLPPGEPVNPIFDLAVDQSVHQGKRTVAEAAAYKKSLREGHADRFLAFIVKELHPKISQHFLIDESRSSLFGYSYGGLFSTWVALQKPALFPIIGAGSPGMLTAESTVFTELDAQVRQGARHDGRALHMTVNDLEILRLTFYQMLGENFARFNAAMGRAPKLGLNFSSEILTGHTHYSGLVPAWHSFLRRFYSIRHSSL